jgi:hypothetical protein
MAQLRQSRKRFFYETGMPADRSFWHHAMEQAGLLDCLSESSVRYHRRWTHERSNCPELASTIEDLIDSLPVEWLSRARNIFVGRVMDGEANATAWSHRQAGMVSIGVQFTFAVEGYVTAFDEYVSAARNLINVLGGDALENVGDNGLESHEDAAVRALEERFDRPWEHLSESYYAWADRHLVASWNVDLLKIAKPRQNIINEAVNACEQFVVAHELGHHLLGHTNLSLPRNVKARKALDQVLENPDLFDRLRYMNPDQVQEAHADILAFLIVAHVIDRAPAFAQMYRAIMGSVIALTAMTHLSGAWIETDSGATHPSFLDRIAIIEILTRIYSAGRPRGHAGDHPLDLLAQLQTFVAIAARDWFARNMPDKYRPARFLDAVAKFLDLRWETLSDIGERDS